MGQLLGCANIAAAAMPFTNLNGSQLCNMLGAFHDIAEDFGLTITDFKAIMRLSLMEKINFCEKRLEKLSEALFHLYDDDNNALVDSLEFLSSICIVSCLNPQEKISHLFKIFNLDPKKKDNSDLLSADGLALLLRVVVSGVAKISGLKSPNSAKIDLIATCAFNKSGDGKKVTMEEFIFFALNNPEILSWIHYFSGIEEERMRISLQLEPNHLTSEDDSKNQSIEKKMMKEIEGTTNEYKSWQDSAISSMPHKENKSKKLPCSLLSLEWIHGRNKEPKVLCTAKNEILYAAGATIVKSVKENRARKQHFFIGHERHILALALFDQDGHDSVIASSEWGSEPQIAVWSVETMETLATFFGFHKGGVSMLNFSPSGELLISVGLDKAHSIAIYEWRKSRTCFTSIGSSEAVQDCCFLSSDFSFGLCGRNYVHFWSRTSTPKCYVQQRGIFGSHPRQHMICMASTNDAVITGSNQGKLFVWKEQTCVENIKLHHTGAITAIHTADSAFCVGTEDGKIYLLKQSFDITMTFNPTIYSGCLKQNICTVFWNPEDHLILVGVESGELFEMLDTDGSINERIQQSHFDVITGVSVSPLQPRNIVTVGQDKTLRMWDLSKNVMIRTVLLNAIPMCVSYNSNGTQVGLGYGAGFHALFLEEDFSLLHEGRDTDCSLTACKFSINGEAAAFGSEDGSIYIYHANNFNFIAKTNGHTGKITNIDFGHKRKNKDSLFIQSNCDRDKLFFWNIKGEQEESPDVLREVDWETQTCVLSWPFLGAHNLGGNHTNVDVRLQSCARSMNGRHLCCLDYCGRIYMYLFPIELQDQGCLVFNLHADSVKHVSFIAGDKVVCTSDGCIFKLNHTTYTIGDNIKQESLKSSDGSLDPVDGESLDIIDKVTVYKSEASIWDNSGISPWLRTICAPTRENEGNVTEPDNELTLDWIHGYNGKYRNNLFYYCPNGKILYPVGKIIIIYDVRDEKQYFYRRATGEITCITLSPKEPLCAIGEVGPFPSIYLFDVETLKTIKSVRGQHRTAISALNFNPEGKYLITCSGDVNQTIILYKIGNEILAQFVIPSCVGRTLDVKFFPDNQSGFVQCGANFPPRFWKNNGTFKDADMMQEGNEQSSNQNYYSVSFIGNSPIIGDGEGNLYLFFSNKLEVTVKAHDAAIYTIAPTKDGIITGSQDGSVKVWGPNLSIIAEVDVRKIGSHNAQIRSVCWNNALRKILVGTQNNEIWELAISGRDHTSILRGPSNCNLTLSINPVKSCFITTGSDKMIKQWSLFGNKILKYADLNMFCGVCSYSSDGLLIALGFGTNLKHSSYDGTLKIVLDDNNFSCLYERKDSNECITEIKWSCDSNKLAVGSYDANIYLYKVNHENLSKVELSLSHTLKGHNSSISHIDFSIDSLYLQSNCASYELLYFEVDTGDLITAASRLKDVEWFTQSCPVGWSIKGVWSSECCQMDVTSVDCTLKNKFGNCLVACGYSCGTLKLFRYPCHSFASNFKRYDAHLGMLSKACWSSGHSHLITVGGFDNAIMVWKNIVHEKDIMETYDAISSDEIRESSSAQKREQPCCSVQLPPELSLEKLGLYYVHGLQFLPSSNCVFYNSTGNLVYATSRFCVVLERYRQKQRIQDGHQNEISCLTISPCKRFVACGDISSKPHVTIFDGQNCETICLLNDFHSNSISLMSFSPDSKSLLTVGAEYNNKLCIWQSLNGEWNDSIQRCGATNGVHKITFCHFSAFASNGPYKLLCGGANHLKFWKIQGPDLIPSKGLFNAADTFEEMKSAVAIKEHFVTGSINGNLFIWNERELERKIKVYENSVDVMKTVGADFFITGTCRFIGIWSSKLEKTFEYELGSRFVQTAMEEQRIISVDGYLNTSKTDVTKILVATVNEIFEVSIDTGNKICLHEAHHFGECWGLSMHPKDPDIFATSGDDSTLRIWSIKNKNLLQKFKSDCPIRAICWSIDALELLVGCGKEIKGSHDGKDGTFMIIESASMNVKFVGRHSKQWITDAKYSPDSKTFALSSADNIFVHKNTVKYPLLNVLDKHNGRISRFDYSSDSLFIRSISEDCEHLVYDIRTNNLISDPAPVKDDEWIDNEALGLNQLKSFITKAHIKSVAKCRFNCNKTYAITIGQFDRAIFIWKLKID